MADTSRGARSASAPALKDPIYPLVSRGIVVGKAKDKRRAKRSGYEHKAALPTDSKLLYMPSEDRPPKTKANPIHMDPPAGIESEKFAKMVSTFMNARIGVTKSKPIYHPSPYTDPITHKSFEAPFFQRDFTKAQGAAGKKAQELVSEKTKEEEKKRQDRQEQQMCEGCRKRSVPRPKQPDPFAHMKLGPAPISKGRKRYPWQYSNCKVAIDHQGGSPKPKLSPEEEKRLHKKLNRQVLLGSGKYSYAMHGEMDRLPSGTNKYNKADWPPSYLLKFDNDRRCGIQPSKRAMPVRSMTLFSSDEIYAMFGMRRPPSPDLTKRRSIDISRELHIKAEKMREERALKALVEGGKSEDLWAATAEEEDLEDDIAHLIAKEEGLSTQSSDNSNAMEDTDRTTTVRLRSGPGSLISDRAQSARGSMRSPRLSMSVPQSARSPSASSAGRPSMPQSARALTRTASDSGIGQAARGGSPAAGSMLSARSSSLTSSAAALRAALAQSALAAAATPSRRDSATGRIMWRSSSSPAINKRPSQG
mmetsp:Transcript_21244/g.39360  ORF Transcript_21244/g.39360 Transcript_21244/m.39360 type:complete len:533 (+) Transcript_21244:36-1634(+)